MEQKLTYLEVNMKKLIGKILFSLIILSTLTFAASDLFKPVQFCGYYPGCGTMIVVNDCCVPQKPAQYPNCSKIYCW